MKRTTFSLAVEAVDALKHVRKQLGLAKTRQFELACGLDFGKLPLSKGEQSSRHSYALADYALRIFNLEAERLKVNRDELVSSAIIAQTAPLLKAYKEVQKRRKVLIMERDKIERKLTKLDLDWSRKIRSL